MRVLLAPLVLALSFACAPSRDRVSVDGHRGVRIGMTVDEASVAYGATLSPAVQAGPTEACFFVFPEGRVDAVSFMIVDGKVARVDIAQPDVLTLTGVGVGSTEAEVMQAYDGKAVLTPHKYTGPEGHYLTVEPDAGKAIVFETDGMRVLRYRAGAKPQVLWVEGCS